MQKHIIKLLLLIIAFTFALSANYIFAVWTGPTQAPPGGNTPTPIHVGTTNQVKNGGLSLDALSVFGGGYFQGNVGVGVVTPTNTLEVAGDIKATEGIKIGNTSDTDAGTIRWTGTDFEGYDGTQWISLTTGNIAVLPGYTDCVNAGADWVDAQGVCYFPGSSCPSGWMPKENYSTTKSGSCSSAARCFGYRSYGPYPAPGAFCSTSSHIRQNKEVETCSYNRYFLHARFAGECVYDKTITCYASKTEVGCVKVQ
ncbi:MAG: hypothetical protein AAB475_01565 [Patescibacteria group bacterium]